MLHCIGSATQEESTVVITYTLVVAILSPILSAISDVMRGKKRFLAFFFGLGIVGTGLLVLAFLLGPALFSGLAEQLDTKRSILLALTVYAAIAVWGDFLDSVVEVNPSPVV